MVKANFPQQHRQSVISESDFPPQGLLAVTAEFLLEVFPGAAVAYSLRLLRKTFTGSAIRVRRSSDGVEQDIGFLSDGNLDLPALTSFVGGSDGQVKIWFDQSGNGINLDDNTDNTKLPLIIIAGVLQKSNNVVSMLFDGVNDTLLSTLSLPTPADHLFIFTVGRKPNAGNNTDLFNFNFPDATNHVFVRVSNAGMIIWDGGPSATNRLTSPQNFNDDFHHILGFSKTAGTDNQKILFDSTEIAQRTQGSTSTVLDQILLGSNADIAPFANFEYQELIFYDIDQLANFVAISNAMINYWKSVTFLTEDSLNILTTENDIELVTEA